MPLNRRNVDVVNDQSVSGAKTFLDDLKVTSGTVSSSTTSGAVVVTGGVGISEDLYVNSNIVSSNLTLSSLSDQGSESTVLSINGSNVVGTVELGSNAFSSVSYQPANTALTTSSSFGGDVSGTYNAIIVANDSHTHDTRYYTETEVDTFFNRSYTSQTHSAVNLPVGWYTIAVVSSGRAIGRFALWDTGAGRHQHLVFYAAHSYGTDASNTITVLHHSRYSGNPFRYIRIKDLTTYDGAAIQVYIDDTTNSVNVAIVGDNVTSPGWIVKDFIADATDPGDVSTNSLSTNGTTSAWASFTEAARVDLDQADLGGIVTTGPIYADGDTTQYKVLTTNDGIVSDTGVPAILGTGGTPTLNTGVTATEVTNLIGAAPVASPSFTGKVTVTSATYNDHLELVRSSEQWQFAPSTDGSLDILRPSGTGTAAIDFAGNFNTTNISATGTLSAGKTSITSTQATDVLRVATSTGYCYASIAGVDGQDAGLIFQEGTSNRCMVGHDQSEDQFRIYWYNNTGGTAINANRLTLTSTGNLAVTGTLTASGYNNTNWDTAYTYSQVGHLPLAGGTITGNLQLTGADGENALTLTGSSPTMAFQDNTASAYDYYIHVNSNIFYVLTDRGAGGTYNAWETPHPLQLDASTNIGYMFGSRVFRDDYHPNADVWTTARSHTVTLTGDVTGTATQTGVDGSGNLSLSITATVGDDSHAHKTLFSTDDRDVKPNTTGISGGVQAIKPFFTSLGGMTGVANADYQDLLVLDTYSDASGGNPNAITFDKSEIAVRLWQGSFDGTTWGTSQRVFADNYHPNADKWTTARSHTVTLTGDVTGTATQTGVDGTGNLSLSITATVGDDTHSHSNYIPITGGSISGTLSSTVASGTNILSWTSGAGLRRITTQGGTLLYCDSSLVLHAGDQAGNIAADLGIEAATTAETLHLTADGITQIRTNYQSGIGTSKVWTFDANGNLSAPGSISAGTTTSNYSTIWRGAFDKGIYITPHTDNYARILFGGNGSSGEGVFRWDDTNNKFEVYANGTLAATIDSNGRVGIGDNDPSFKLCVTDSVDPATTNPFNNSSSMVRLENINTSANTYTTLSFNGADNTGIGRHAASISMLKNGTWTAGSGNYSGSLVFLTRPTSGDQVERMRISHDGNISMSGNLLLDNGAADGAQIAFYSAGNSTWENDNSSGTMRWYISGSGVKWSFDTSGNCTAAGNITAYSDARLKTDIETLDGSKVYEMRGVSFTKDGQKGSGVIAQELLEVAPELVNDSGEYLSVAYGNLTGYLIEAVKEQNAVINNQQAQIDQLRQSNNNAVDAIQELMRRVEQLEEQLNA